MFVLDAWPTVRYLIPIPKDLATKSVREEEEDEPMDPSLMCTYRDPTLGLGVKDDSYDKY